MIRLSPPKLPDFFKLGSLFGVLFIGVRYSIGPKTQHLPPVSSKSCTLPSMTICTNAVRPSKPGLGFCSVGFRAFWGFGFGGFGVSWALGFGVGGLGFFFGFGV